MQWQKKASFSLTPAAIDQVSAWIHEAAGQTRDQRTVLRLRLSVEEILNTWQQVLGEHTPCTCEWGVRWGRRYLRLSATGAYADPHEAGQNDQLGLAGNAILANLGLAPVYRYHQGVNQITLFPPGKKRSGLLEAAVAFASAAALGALSLLLPEPVSRGIAQGFVMPLYQALLGLLTGVAGPMIFLSICRGIINIGDISLLGKVGKKFLTAFLALTFLVTALEGLALLWMLPLGQGQGAPGAGALGQIWGLVLAMVPANLVSPFLEGNALQIIVLGSGFGIAFLILGDKAAQAGKLIEQLDQVVQLLMAGICRLLPAFIFLSVYPLAASGMLGELANILSMILLFTLVSLALLALYTLVFCLRQKVSVPMVAAKLLPSFLVALTTASSAATFSLRLEAAEKQLGVPGKIANFSVPLSQVIFQPGAATLFFIPALYLGKMYQVDMSVSWLAVAVLLAAVLAVAVPPVPGGGLTSASILLLSLGIPEAGLAFFIAANAILDFLATATDGWCQLLEIAAVTGKLGMLDQAVLAKPRLEKGRKGPRA